MIKHLYLKNFILIAETDLDFSSGFSVFTGETGAGKSILIDSLVLLTAQRVSTDVVRHGEKRAVIEGTFALGNDAHACAVLADAGFDVEEETVCTREISAAGKSTARIDRRVVSLSFLRDVLQNEIDIHGQRDHEFLLNSNKHISLLDEYMQADDLVEKTASSYEAWQRLIKEKDTVMKEQNAGGDADYLRFAIHEIDSAHLTVGEDEELLAKEKAYKAMQAQMSKIEAVLSLHNERFSGDFYEIDHTLQGMNIPELNQSTEAIDNAYYSVMDAMEQISRYADAMDLSEEDVNEMEERLFVLQKLKRKYASSIERILAKRDQMAEQLHILENRESYFAEMDQKIAKAYSVFTDYSQQLHAKRVTSSSKLDQEVETVLKELMLPHARFETRINTANPSRHGLDAVEFYISMNPQEACKPLNKVASGGELSRLMLGLKVIFTKLAHVETVIFDEIDTGVSGPVATAIGRKMYELSRSCQVFAVTHLAQVAACGDHHYLVQKSVDDEGTHTEIQQLDMDERIDQLALIASGKVTDLSRQAAKELLQRNHS